jgi:hypothetical protein
MARLDAIDIVVGTMEGSLTGGGSNSVMALLLTAALVYLLAAYREGILPMRRLLPLVMLVTLPLILGEVKLIIVLIPLAMITIYLDLVRRNLLKFLSSTVFAMALLAVLGWAYLLINAEPGQSVSQIVESTIAYNFGEIGYYGGGLNRTSIYPYWLEHQHLSNPIGIFFGHGLGSSFGGINDPNPGHMDKAHPWMYIGLTAASSVLWDLGVVGLLLLVGMYLSAIFSAARLVRSAEPGFDRALCRALLALALMLIVMLVYNDAPIAVPSQEVLAALCFGLIAWRWRSVGKANRASVAGRAR